MDSYSAAESGIVSLGSTFEPYGTQTATTFRIVSKGTISVTCYNSIPKWEQDPTDLVQVISFTIFTDFLLKIQIKLR